LCYCTQGEGDNMDRFDNWVPPVIEHGVMTRWCWMVYHPTNLRLGRKTDIGAFTFINALYGVEIGEGVQIGGGCLIYSISTIGNLTGKVVLEAGCMIGAHSTIMPGVTVGRGAIVGAHSFVNKDVPAGWLALGVPAKPVRRIEGK